MYTRSMQVRMAEWSKALYSGAVKDNVDMWRRYCNISYKYYEGCSEIIETPAVNKL